MEVGATKGIRETKEDYNLQHCDQFCTNSWYDYKIEQFTAM
jgi:hypothetical protein